MKSVFEEYSHPPKTHMECVQDYSVLSKLSRLVWRGSDGSLIKHQTMYQMHIMYFQGRKLYMFIANSIQSVEDCCHLISFITSDMSDRCVYMMSQTVIVDMQSHNMNAQTSQREIPKGH